MSAPRVTAARRAAHRTPGAGGRRRGGGGVRRVAARERVPAGRGAAAGQDTARQLDRLGRSARPDGRQGPDRRRGRGLPRRGVRPGLLGVVAGVRRAAAEEDARLLAGRVRVGDPRAVARRDGDDPQARRGRGLRRHRGQVLRRRLHPARRRRALRRCLEGRPGRGRGLEGLESPELQNVAFLEDEGLLLSSDTAAYLAHRRAVRRGRQGRARPLRPGRARRRPAGRGRARPTTSPATR